MQSWNKKVAESVAENTTSVTCSGVCFCNKLGKRKKNIPDYVSHFFANFTSSLPSIFGEVWKQKICLGSLPLLADISIGTDPFSPLRDRSRIWRDYKKNNGAFSLFRLASEKKIVCSCCVCVFLTVSLRTLKLLESTVQLCKTWKACLRFPEKQREAALC